MYRSSCSRFRWFATRLTASAAICVALTGAAQNAAPNPATARHARSRRFLSGRSLPVRGAAAQALNLALEQHAALAAAPRSSLLNAPWTAVGPAQVTTPQFGNVTGRVTAIALDPADSTGNTVYVGTTGGGVWKSTNAAGPAAAVTFAPLTDTLSVFNGTTQLTPSLSIGSLAFANGVLLAGTGDPNDATDSYYGAGILRSADGGATWTLAQQSVDAGAGTHPFFGLSVAGLAFSTLNTSIAVAALSQSAEGAAVNAADATYSEMGLYVSSDAGLTWRLATLMDGSAIVQNPLSVSNNGGGNAVTSVVWNPLRQSFYAAVQYHGYYASPDGITWTRLASQPGAGLTTSACPRNAGSAGLTTCPIFRGVLAVQPVSGDMFALTVDAANRDQGLFQDVCAARGSACGNPSVAFGNVLKSTPLETGNGSNVIAQGDYNLALAATASGTDTLLFAGTVDLFRCSLAAGCALRNTTNAQNGCANTALVAPAQHAIAAAGSLVFIGNDGGLWRSIDGVNQHSAPCSLDDATHFQNLNGSLGSLAEVVSFAQAPSDSGTLLAGLGALGTAATSAVTNSWTQLSAGEGGTVAIDPSNPLLWYLSNAPAVSIARCAKGASCTTADFAATAIGPAQVANDPAAVHAAWLLDPALPSDLIAGTCRVWRGPATGGGLWSSANQLSRPFATPAASACSATSPVVRSLAAGGPVSQSSNAQTAGSEALYAGMAASYTAVQGIGGHLFVTSAAHLASGTTAWRDAATSPVFNDVANNFFFNPGGFDISSIAVDSHDASGATVYATVMGFHQNGINTAHVYRSIDSGAHWTNISANLPNAPANSVAVDPNDANTLYVALDTGVYVTTQVATCVSTNCWSVLGIALPNSPVIELQAAASMATGDGRTGELRAATYGRGIWQIPLLTAIGAAAPAISISPSSVTYSTQQVGTASASVTITVTNSGSAALTVSAVSTTGDFYQSNNCTGTAIQPSATCAVQVSFLPTATGVRTGLLTVFGNVSGGQATAALSGTATPAAAIVLTPPALAFAATSVGATTAVKNITIANTGGTSATLQTPVVTGDFTLSGNTCTSTLAAATSCTLSVVFAPSASGARAGTVTVVDSAGTQVASLSGTGLNPATDALSPGTLSFAAQQLNTTSAGQSVTLTNAGDAALTLIAPQIVSGDFSVVNGCGNSLTGHATCSFTVTFSPKSVGQQAGVLSVADQFRSQTVALSGVGLAGPGVSLSPTGGLQFGGVGVGSASAAQTITLTNNGGVPLVVNGVAAGGDFALAPGSNTCLGTLAPSAVCTVQVVFSPSVAGVRAGTVTFSDSAPNAPQVLTLSGIGVDFSLASNGPSSITVSSGQSATYGLLLTSVNGLPGSAMFTCAGVPAHALCTVNPATAALGGSTPFSVTVATGLATASVDAPAMPWSHQLIWLALMLPAGLAFRRNRRAVFLLVFLVALAGCGTSRTLPGNAIPGATVTPTPTGTYNIVVAGSSAGLVRSANLTLVVQ